MRECRIVRVRQSVSADTRVASELVMSMAASAAMLCSSSTIAQDRAVRISKRKLVMASQKQRRAAKKNIEKAIKAAKRKQTLKHLPKKTRQALGKQAAKVRQSRE
jgi:polysaccharide deacetylase 2 family uncharacterized protein YibQ